MVPKQVISRELPVYIYPSWKQWELNLQGAWDRRHFKLWFLNELMLWPCSGLFSFSAIGSLLLKHSSPVQTKAVGSLRYFKRFLFWMLHVHPCWFVSELIVSVRVAFNRVTTNAQMPCFLEQMARLRTYMISRRWGWLAMAEHISYK